MTEPDHIDRLVWKWSKERPDYDLAPVQIIGRIGRIFEYIDRALETKFAEFDVSRASFDVLATLKRSGPPYRLSQRELMKNLLRTSGSMSIRIDAMERDLAAEPGAKATLVIGMQASFPIPRQMRAAIGCLRVTLSVVRVGIVQAR